MKYLIGYDLGSSSVKVVLLDINSGKALATATSPEQEMKIIAREAGWAEQHPDDWWQEICSATHKLKSKYNFDPTQVAAIGISYQMHGLVAVDKDLKVLRPSIIWCDSRAVAIGNKAAEALGNEYCQHNLLNSPGNFTASKLKWVKENEPALFEKIKYIMLPGDFVAMRMSGQPQTTISGLSEGIFWDFKNRTLSTSLLQLYGIESSIIPPIVDTFSFQTELTEKAAAELGLSKGIPIGYRAGDQPNNAFSLNVLKPGEVATTAGTSGVVYGINSTPTADPLSRVNSFVHVNDSEIAQRNGVLLCINGTGILNSWVRQLTGKPTYDDMNRLAATISIGANGLCILPFGNGAERVLENKNLGAKIAGLNFNIHTHAHLYRAVQEGIVFALHYGMKIMQQMGVQTKVIKAGHANMFLSAVFREAFANTTGATIELYDTDGAQGAARGAGIGIGVYSFDNAFDGLQHLHTHDPTDTLTEQYQEAYQHWEKSLHEALN